MSILNMVLLCRMLTVESDFGWQCCETCSMSESRSLLLRIPALLPKLKGPSTVPKYEVYVPKTMIKIPSAETID